METLAKASFGKAVSDITSSVQDATGININMGAVPTAAPAGPAPIAWAEKNWPAKRGKLALVHFDMAELKEKRSAGVVKLVKTLHLWWKVLAAWSAFNFLNTIIVGASIKGSAYKGGSVAMSLFESLVLYLPFGFATVFYAYRGWADGSGRDKTMARAFALVMFVVGMIMMIANGLNVHGWTTFKSGRFDLALLEGSASSAVGYWKFAVVVESLIWIALEGLLGWGIFLLFKTAA